MLNLLFVQKDQFRKYRMNVPKMYRLPFELCSSHNTNVNTSDFFLISLQEHEKPKSKAAHLTTTPNNTDYVEASVCGLPAALRVGPQ